MFIIRVALIIAVMKIIFYKKPLLKNPVMLAGLPGMGLVAKQVVDYFIRKLDAEFIGEFEEHYPPTSVVVFNNGILLPMAESSFKFYCWSGNDRSLLLFTGNYQPRLSEEQHRIAEKVVRIAQEFNVSRIYTTAAMATYRYVEAPKVYGVVTKPGLLRELKNVGVEEMPGEGSISGLNGLIISYAQKLGIEGICLLGETYLVDSVDVKAALAILRKLITLLGITVDLSEVEEIAKRVDEETRRVLEKFKEKRDKSLGYIS